MRVEKFAESLGAEYFVGVPDSQLKALCEYLITKYGVNNNNHVIAANEGNAVGMAAGYYLSTGKIPVVYMQNSGEGNTINPLASLMNEKVYGIPCICVIGWRGEPGVHDEPQHIFQGEITLNLLDVMQIPYVVIDKETSDSSFDKEYEKLKASLKNGKSVAVVVRKGALSFEGKVEYENNYSIMRETALEKIIEVSDGDVIVSTTGKTSREVFEIRERRNQGHEKDFLTVGSMGHCSSIACGIAQQQPEKRVWCIDGDGAVIMHMGAMTTVGMLKPKNLIHIVINNEAHESVGGMPTAMNKVDLPSVARACGYDSTYVIDSEMGLLDTLKDIRRTNGLTFVEIKCRIGSRADLGRPTVSAKENKEAFMKYLLEV